MLRGVASPIANRTRHGYCRYGLMAMMANLNNDLKNVFFVRWEEGYVGVGTKAEPFMPLLNDVFCIFYEYFNFLL